MYAADIDGDVYPDILIVLFLGNEIRWYKKHSNGNFTEHLITTEADGPKQDKKLKSLSSMVAYWFAWGAFYPNTSIAN